MSKTKSSPEVLEHAKILIAGGISRRRMDKILREEHGQSIGKQAHSRLFNERIQDLVNRETSRHRGYKHTKNTRQERYNILLNKHFVPKEANQLAHVKDLRSSHEIQRMMAQRDNLYNRFIRRAATNGWKSTDKLDLEWNKTITRWYKAHNYVTGKPGPINKRGVLKKDRKPSVWEWFNKVKNELPPELQSGSTHSTKRKRQDFITSDKVLISRRINTLLKLQQQSSDPGTKGFYQRKIEQERGKLK